MLKKLNKLKRELIKKEGDIRVLQQRIKELEREKVSNFEHSELMCKLTNALKGYTQTLEFETYVNKKYNNKKRPDNMPAFEKFSDLKSQRTYMEPP